MAKEKVEENEFWLQDLIVAGLAIGISKKELLEDYYWDEIPLIFEAYSRLHDTKKKEEVEEAYIDDIW
jgi:hypothetical protein